MKLGTRSANEILWVGALLLAVVASSLIWVSLRESTSTQSRRAEVVVRILLRRGETVVQLGGNPELIPIDELTRRRVRGIVKGPNAAIALRVDPWMEWVEVVQVQKRLAAHVPQETTWTFAVDSDSSRRKERP